MGCDIHLYIERKVNGNWLSCNTWVQKLDEKNRIFFTAIDKFSYRNYKLFAALCGVRNNKSYNITPLANLKGMPNDVSEIVYQAYDRWKDEYHSISYLSIYELDPLFGKGDVFPEFFAQIMDKIDRISMSEFNIIDEDHRVEDVRIVFWFDN